MDRGETTSEEQRGGAVLTGFASLRRLPSTSARWRSPAWREELTRWVAGVLGRPRSLTPVKIRPWATVWRVDTASGVHFAKQNCPAQSYEAALLVELNALVPHRVVPLTAVDLDRGLLMTPDQGPVLGESLDDLDAWCRVVQAGAQLQREVAPHVARLAATGLTTLAPADARTYVEQLLAQLGGLPEVDVRGLRPEEQASLRELLPAVDRWAGQVAGLGLPLSLVHNDLHGNNVFPGERGLVFFDFGDAMLMDPLAALVIPLDLLAFRLAVGPDDPRLHRVADAALEVWSDLAAPAALRAALPAALRLARLGRTETWMRCLASMDDAELDEWGGAAATSLVALRRPSPVGRQQA